MSVASLRRASASSLAVAGVAVLTLVPLVAWDVSPGLFPDGAHDLLGAVPLASIAVACVVHALVQKARPVALLKAGMLATAFLFWAANQLWPDRPQATLFNDVAVALFVVDVLFSILVE